MIPSHPSFPAKAGTQTLTQRREVGPRYHAEHERVVDEHPPLLTLPPSRGERAFFCVIASVAKQPRGLTRNDVAVGHVQAVRKGLAPRLRGENGRGKQAPYPVRGKIHDGKSSPSGESTGEAGVGGLVFFPTPAPAFPAKAGIQTLSHRLKTAL